MWFIVNIPSLGKFESKDIVSYAFIKKKTLFVLWQDQDMISYTLLETKKNIPFWVEFPNSQKKKRGFLRWDMLYIWVFPKMVVPPKHPKMTIFSRKTQ